MSNDGGYSKRQAKYNAMTGMRSPHMEGNPTYEHELSKHPFPPKKAPGGGGGGGPSAGSGQADGLNEFVILLFHLAKYIVPGFILYISCVRLPGVSMAIFGEPIGLAVSALCYACVAIAAVVFARLRKREADQKKAWLFIYRMYQGAFLAMSLLTPLLWAHHTYHKAWKVTSPSFFNAMKFMLSCIVLLAALQWFLLMSRQWKIVLAYVLIMIPISGVFAILMSQGLLK